MSIADRVIEDDRGRLVLLRKPSDTVLRMVNGEVRHVRKDADVALSDKGKHPAPDESPVIGPRNSILSRSECGALLGVPIEEAAKLLDEWECPRQIGYDGHFARALAERLAQGKRPPGPPLGLDPLPEP